METKKLTTILNELEVNPNEGLSSKEAEARLARDGKNAIPKKKKKTILAIFFSQMNNAMIYILLAAALISLIISFWKGENEFLDAIVILVVVLLNSTVGTIQERKAENALEALEKLSAPTTFVRRDGNLCEIKAEDLVVGDIVILEEGRTVPADLRLTSAINLKVSEASLTGESVPIEKDTSVVYKEAVPIGDRKNTVYMSTPVTYGRGEGVVIGTGLNTEIGKIATMLSETKEEKTPLQKRLADLSKLLGIITIVLVVVLFGVALLQKRDVIDMFMTSISLAVAAVPEGLPAVVTIVLSLGVQRMVKVNTIVRKLPSVETLGAVSVICSDKTGTLTQNKMTVVSAYVNHRMDNIYEFREGELEELALCMSLCSDASVDQGVYGDPTEIALVELANVYELRKSYIEKTYPRVDELPFDSNRKMMSTVNVINKVPTVLTKGALDNLLKRSTHIKIDGKVRKITKEDISKIEEGAAKMTNKALRLLALAIKPHDGKVITEEGLTFIGIVGMVDPPRPEAKEAVQTLKEAGITTVMITGDHIDTALAIAEELGIASDPSQAMTGAELDELSDEERLEVVKHKRVYARVSPENKVQIVTAIKANGNIAAMTGDGVNDAPSLRAADIGIAMGITGTDVAKGAADMVLSDDNFVSIEKAVEEGRSIYANIKKTVWFLLSSNFGEVIVMMLAILIGLPAPLAALHILWVNLITDSFPAIALGADAKDPDIMKDKPRSKNESLFANGGYALTIGYGSLIALTSLLSFLCVPFFAFRADPASFGNVFNIASINAFFDSNATELTRAQTYAFTVLGVSQLFHMLGMANIKKTFFRLFNKSEWLIWTAFVVGLLLQILVTEIPFLSTAFSTVELTLKEWLLLAAVSTAPLIVHEIIILVRLIINRIKKQKTA
ncbi:MAG: cation-translocating P-type ATPase [Erysipelotrichaceae bacterium]|nr:cation-translocating P-type ATPase [Erysipelotrichaceae bacterium]